ncbi:restriction endonuclease [Brachyspira aalborgi]|uniref:Restriction endonuclease n=1 Tax=Brachyspira aalborgi TaxID=29522 RepID=A0A5C8F9I2_9SPIR|nr:restriction endonuclease [Brachyspira aalborgi]TXJ45882.1 restriction endonuclease [Brachyspira aalborgi]
MSIIQIADNNYKGVSIDKSDIENIKQFANKKIKYLKENNLFILSKNSFKDDIENSDIIELDEVNNKIYSNNIMGFIGYNDTQIKITSRFTPNSDKDYFLHYMLQKVFYSNIFNWEYTTERDYSFDFLIYMFTHFFQKAIRQGIFKSYQNREYNDANVRGVININRHIKNNIPFNGKIAYNTREYSYDNNITQLIRHTIEYINTKSRGILNINEDIKSGVFQIIEATKRYNKNKRQSIINKNLKKLNHPYFYEYEPLRKICIQILRHEELKYGREENKIYGILFDGSYLWEEYIWTILKDLNFKHPENKTGKGGINLLEKDWEVFPDFYKINNEKNIVLDTKYKRLENKDIDRNDKHQIISYVYTLGAKIGGFVYPLENEEFGCECEEIGTVKNNINHIASIYKYGFLIANKKSNEENFNNIKEFADKIKTSEDKFKEKIENKFQ